MGQGEQILVVEDHGPMAEAIQNILAMHGYVVSTAANGSEALGVMEDLIPDLIIADILMPEMDGYTLYEEVRHRLGWRQVPFIFLTSMAEREDIQKGRDLGVDSYITKPFDPVELLAAVRAQLPGERR